MAEDLGSVYEFQSNIADATEPVPLPVGEYKASVKVVELAKSKASGQPMAVFNYLVSPDQYPADYTDGNADGELLRWYLPLVDAHGNETPRTRWRIKKAMEAHGLAPSSRFVCTDFIGAEVTLVVQNEDFQGSPQARVTGVKAAA